MPAFLRKTIGITLLFVTIGLSTCQSFLEAGQPSSQHGVTTSQVRLP